MLVGLTVMSTGPANSLHAKLNAPIFESPKAMRVLQERLSEHDDVIRTGVYGLHPAALMRYAGTLDADSATSYHVAETLWLEYLCVFGDSTAADVALVTSPAYVHRQGVPSEKVWRRMRIEALAKMNAPSFDQSPSEPVVDLANIPKYHRYVVKSGDSLWRIQKKFPGSRMQDLIDANRGRETIYPGQVLMIPL